MPNAETALNEEQDTALTGQPPAEETSEEDELQPGAEGKTGVDEGVETDEAAAAETDAEPAENTPEWFTLRMSEMAGKNRELAEKVQAHEALAEDPEYGKLLHRAAYKAAYGREMPDDEPAKPEEWKPVVDPDDFEYESEKKIAGVLNDVHKALFETRRELAEVKGGVQEVRQGSTAQAHKDAQAHFDTVVSGLEAEAKVTLTPAQKTELLAKSFAMGRAEVSLGREPTLEELVGSMFTLVIKPNAKRNAAVVGTKKAIAGVQTGNRGGGSREVGPETLSEQEIMERNYKKAYPSG